MTSQQKVELALRAGHLAKCALELTAMSSAAFARLHLVQVADELREIDKFLKKAANVQV